MPPRPPRGNMLRTPSPHDALPRVMVEPNTMLNLLRDSAYIFGDGMTGGEIINVTPAILFVEDGTFRCYFDESAWLIDNNVHAGLAEAAGKSLQDIARAFVAKTLAGAVLFPVISDVATFVPEDTVLDKLRSDFGLRAKVEAGGLVRDDGVIDAASILLHIPDFLQGAHSKGWAYPRALRELKSFLRNL